MVDIITETKQNKKNSPDVVILLDASGSMSSQRESVVSTFNEYVQSVIDIAHTISLYMFDSNGIIEKIYKKPPSQITPLTVDDYDPNAMTPLYDAMGKVMKKFEKSNRNVQFVTHTDGLENDSTEWNYGALEKYINKLTEKGWLFVYLGEGVSGQEQLKQFTGLKLNFTSKNRDKAMYTNRIVTRTYGATGQACAADYTTSGSDSINVDDNETVKEAANQE